ncbi:MAG: hypothetical protein FWE37_08980 [Spirochaetaceae bacterium]|nr:hypothetical protein [Spirochaetaceae bacterium]
MKILTKLLIVLIIAGLAACNNSRSSIPPGSPGSLANLNSGEITGEHSFAFARHGVWFETAFAEWRAPEGMTSFTVEVYDGAAWVSLDEHQGGNGNLSGMPEGQRTHSQFLVRQVDSVTGTWRVDVPGLSNGYHSADQPIYGLRISSGATTLATITNLRPVAFDRQGYAFVGNPAPGAYNQDGTVKANASIFYVTHANMNEVLTGGGSGRFRATGSGTTFSGPTIVRFLGRVGYWNNVAGDRLQIPNAADGNHMLVLRNFTAGMTFEGIGTDAEINGWGFQIMNSSSVVWRNLTFDWYFEDGIMAHGGNADRALRNFWVHHNTFSYGQDTRHLRGRDDDHDKGDGASDFTNQISHFTVSYNHYIETGKSMLIGNNLSDTVGHGTIHHNWFERSEQRTPRVRNAFIHVFNNVYDSTSVYGIAAGHLANIVAEGNIFTGVHRPFMISGQGAALNASGNNALSQDAPGAIITSEVPNHSFWAGRGLVPNAFSNVTRYDPSTDIGASNANRLGAHTFIQFDITTNLSDNIGVQPPSAAAPRVRNLAGVMR